VIHILLGIVGEITFGQAAMFVATLTGANHRFNPSRLQIAQASLRAVEAICHRLLRPTTMVLMPLQQFWHDGGVILGSGRC
jgi:hypothetical protein